MPIVEKLKSYSKGGARPGAGRPKGGENEDARLRRAAEAAYKNRVAKSVDRIFNSQLDLALGEKYLMVTRTTGVGSKQRRETEIVTDPEVIKAYLDESIDNNDEEYYFMTTKPANNSALDSLMSRTFGKPRESIDHTTNGKDIPAPILGGAVKQGTDVSSDDDDPQTA